MSASQKISVISIVLVLLFSMLSVSGLQENFDVYSATPAITACSQSVTTLSLTIKNTGSIESGYSLTANGDALEFATYSETIFSLAPSEAKTVYIYLTPGDRKSSYDLSTTVTSVLGNEKVIEHSIDVKSCANIGVVVRNPIIKKNPCEIAQFGFDISNTGEFPETYSITTNGLNAFTTLSTNFLILGAKETKHIDMFVNPSCDVYGTYDINVDVLAESNQYLAQTKVTLDIAQNYAYEVVLPINQKICNLRETQIPVSVSNKVPFVNQYSVKVSGASWITEESDRVELGPYGNGITHIKAAPVHPGIYPVTIEFKSLRGDVVKSGSYELTVDNCYDADVNVEAPADIIVQGHSITYPITVKNAGTKADNYTFELLSPVWVSANALPVTVKAGETKQFTLTAKPVNVTGNFEAEFRVISKETNTVTKDVIKFSVISAEEAYQLSIKPQHMRVLYGKDFVSFKLENKGTLPATYGLVFRGPQWATTAVKEVTLQPNEIKLLEIPTNTVTKDAQGDYGVELIATVGNEIGFVSQSVVKLRKLTILQTVQTFVMAYWMFIAIAAGVLLIALFFAIFGRRIARAIRDNRIRAKEKARIKAELKAKKKEEKLAQKLIKQQMKASAKANSEVKPQGGFWKVLLTALLLLLLLGGIAGAILGSAGYLPFVKELFKEKESDSAKFQPIIRVNTTGLEAYGNTVIIRGTNVIVPVIVKNNYDEDLIFDVEVDSKWIKTNTKRITLEADEEEVIELLVTPDAAQKGLYVIKISASLEKENKLYTEDITLNVRKKTFVQDVLSYAWYVLAGLALFVAILFFSNRKGKKGAKEVSVKTAPVKEVKVKAKPARKVSINLPKKK